MSRRVQLRGTASESRIERLYSVCAGDSKRGEESLSYIGPPLRGGGGGGGGGGDNLRPLPPGEEILHGVNLLRHRVSHFRKTCS